MSAWKKLWRQGGFGGLWEWPTTRWSLMKAQWKLGFGRWTMSTT